MKEHDMKSVAELRANDDGDDDGDGDDADDDDDDDDEHRHTFKGVFMSFLMITIQRCFQLRRIGDCSDGDIQFKVSFHKVYFCEVYPTLTNFKHCEFIQKTSLTPRNE